jgi:hypothetical protein
LSNSSPARVGKVAAGAEGIEPPSTELETVILPLDDAPVIFIAEPRPPQHPRQDSNLHIAA